MKRSIRAKILGHVVLATFCIVFLIPIYWMFNLSLKQKKEVAALPTVWWPEIPQWGNYVKALTKIDFLGYTRNSLIIAGTVTILTVLSSSLVAFAFARLKARGKNFLFGVLMSTMMLPGIVTLIPIYIMYAKVNLIDTYVPWVLMGAAGSAYSIFLIRQYMMSIPGEIEEAAIVDGCGYFRIWWQIYMPLCKPVLAAVAVLTFVGSWGDFIMPKLLLSSENTTLAVAISTGYVDEKLKIDQAVTAAGSLLYALPVIVVFLFLQKYFVEGFATSGIK